MPDDASQSDGNIGPGNSGAAQGLVVLLVDESAAMQATIGGGTKSLAQSAATALNALLRQLAGQQHLHVALIGYGSNHTGGALAEVRWSGPLAGRTFVPARELVDGMLRVEQRTRNVPSADGSGAARAETIEFPIWYEGRSEGPADEAAGLELCAALVRQWNETHERHAGTVPLIFHVAAELRDEPAIGVAAAAIVDESQPSEPSARLFQAQLGTRNAPATLYPATDAGLPPGPVQAVFRRVSELPAHLAAALRAEGHALGDGARGLILDAHLPELIQFLSLARYNAGELLTASAGASAEPQSHPPALGSSEASSPLTPSPFPTNRTGDRHSAREAGGPALVWIELRHPSVVRTAATPAPERRLDEPTPQDETVAVGDPGGSAGSAEPVAALEQPVAPVRSSLPRPVHESAKALLVLLVDLSAEDMGSAEQLTAVAKLQAAVRWLLGELATAADGSTDLALVCYGQGRSRHETALWGLDGPLAQPKVASDVQLARRGWNRPKSSVTVPDYPATTRGSLRPVSGGVVELAVTWIARHPDAVVPPTIVHYTAGVMNVDELFQLARQLAGVKTTSGAARLGHFVHTSRVSASLAFPERAGELHDVLLQKLWECSSPLVEFGEDSQRGVARRALAVNMPSDVVRKLLPGRLVSSRT